MVKRSLATMLVLALAVVLVDKQESEQRRKPQRFSSGMSRNKPGSTSFTTMAPSGRISPRNHGPGVAFIDYDNDGWPDIFS